MSKIKKSTIYFVLFFSINIAVGFSSYLLEHNMRVTGNWNDSYWNILAVIYLCTWCVALIKVTNPMHLRICSYFFLLLIFDKLLYYFSIIRSILVGLAYLLYPVEIGFHNASMEINSSLYNIWYALVLGTILIAFYVAFYLKYEHSLDSKQNTKFLLATEMFSILVIFFESCNIKISNNIHITITIVVIAIWLFSIFHYRQDRNVLFRIMVIWLIMSIVIVLNYLSDVLLESIFSEFRKLLNEVFLLFHLLFPGAILLSETNPKTYWNWAIVACVLIITFYAIFSYIRIKKSNKLG